MHYDILHDLPGRLRVHCRGVRLHPESAIELNRWLDEHDALKSASLSVRTGNLLVTYSRTASRESILILLDNLELFGVARVAGTEDKPEYAVAMSERSPEMEFFWLLAKPFLPTPVRLMLAGWRTTLKLFDLFQPLAEGKVSTFGARLAQLLIRILLGQSLPLRLFLMFARITANRYFGKNASLRERFGFTMETRQFSASRLLTLDPGTKTSEAAG